MANPPQNCTIRHAIIRPREVYYLRFILEAYEGIAVLSTINAQLGLIQLRIAPGCERDVERILEADRERLQLRPIYP
jgi:hypothetical protein